MFFVGDMTWDVTILWHAVHIATQKNNRGINGIHQKSSGWWFPKMVLPNNHGFSY